MVQLINDLTDGTRKLSLLHHQFRVLRGEFWIERSDASQQYLFEIVFRVELSAPNSLIVGVLHYGCRRFCRREQLIRELSIVLCGGEYQVLSQLKRASFLVGVLVATKIGRASCRERVYIRSVALELET